MMRRAIVVLACLLLVASACSLGPKEDWAESMRNADDAAAKIGSAKTTITIATKVVETTIRQTPQPLFTQLEGIVDFAHRTSKLVVSAPKARAKSQVYFHDLVAYLQRSKSSLGKGTKHWARFSFEQKPDPDIDANDRRLSIGTMVAPTLAVELLQGVLAGSIQKVKTGSDGTVEYTSKLAPDAAVRDLRDEERVKGIARMFETFGENQDVFPVRVWVSPQGLVTRLRFALRQEKDRVNVFATTIDYRFSNFGASPALTLPQRSDSVTSKRYEDFISEYIRELV